MQKRSCEAYPIIYDNYKPQGEFPATLTSMHSPSDSLQPLHAHDCLEVGICYKGAGIFIVDGRILPFKAGDVSVIFNNQIHIAQSERENISSWIFTNIDLIKLFEGLTNEYILHISNLMIKGKCIDNIISCERNPELTSMMHMIYEELDKKSEGYKLSVRGLLLSFLTRVIRLNENHGDETERGRRAYYELAKVAPALNYIAGNYMEDIYISKLAELCKLSVPHFRRVFKSGVGASPNDYINEIRIKMASILLNTTDKTILEVSTAVGFNSLSSFNRNFKTITGATPLKLRRNY